MTAENVSFQTLPDVLLEAELPFVNLCSKECARVTRGAHSCLPLGSSAWPQRESPGDPVVLFKSLSPMWGVLPRLEMCDGPKKVWIQALCYIEDIYTISLPVSTFFERMVTLKIFLEGVFVRERRWEFLYTCLDL